MRDLAIRLENRPGALAEMGEALGSAGVSVEGGGAFLFDGRAIARSRTKGTSVKSIRTRYASQLQS